MLSGIGAKLEKNCADRAGWQSKGAARLISRERDTMQNGKAQVRLPLGAFCTRLWRAIDAPRMHPGFSLASLKGKLSMVQKCLENFQALRRWHSMTQDRTFEWMVDRHPLFPALHPRPYINAMWSPEESRQVLETHYTMLKGAASILHFPPDESVPLALLDEEVEEGLRLTLDKPPWLVDEGEVGINLFRGGARVYTLMFTLGQRDGRRVAYVGAIQGKAGGHGLDMNRHLTRAAHAMRPRDLLFAAFRMLCAHLQIDTIFGIADAHNICHSAYFKGRKRVFAQHDPAWKEYGGVIRPDGFFEIAVPLPYREEKDIPVRKRTLYRRRYDMLHRIDAAIASRLKDNNCATSLEPPATYSLLFALPYFLV